MAIDECGSYLRLRFCTMVARQGTLEVLQFVRQDARCTLSHETSAAAVQAQRQNVVEYVWMNKCPFGESAGLAAAQNGNVELIEYLYEQVDLSLTHRMLNAAATNGDLTMIRWWRSRSCEWNVYDLVLEEEGTLCHGIRSQSVEVIQELRDEGCPLDVHASATAAEWGNLELLQSFQREGCPFNGDACMCAAKHGHLHILKWLRAQGCAWDSSTCSSAKGGGHFETLQWALDQGCPCDESACRDAAWGNHLDLLKWLRSKNYPWNAWTCAAAGDRGHLETLRWAHENNCPWHIIA